MGGVASHMHNLAIKLRSRGHEVAVVTNDRETGKEYELERSGVRLVKIPGFVSPLFDVNITYSMRSSKDLSEFLSDFDVVHSHHAFTPLALKAVKAGRILKKASVLTTHSISLAHDSELWDIVGLTVPIFSTYLKYPSRVIAVSKAAEEFIKHFTDVPVSVIPNGVDTNVFRPARNGREKELAKARFGLSGRSVVLYVGRMSYRKGPHLLLSAFANIDDEKAVLVMVGTGDMLPLLKLQAKLLGVESRVMFMNYVSDALLPEIYRASDVFVAPSIVAEAFGLVILEAMASGVPVIATSVGGIPEILSSSGAGMLVAPSSERELSEAISALLADRGLREIYGENGRRVVEEKYSWDIVVEQIERVYIEAISEL
ncbi:MAG: glycosyltransferase family 4 protein [Sulfolobales archaeon]|nr:glycosyltransferase family 4 protein [Sulfolobales archaeon]MCX8208548.1 glycosyltransferase family 4 protein [Sulfolobales archaeon]